MHTDKPMQIVKPFAGHESSKKARSVLFRKFRFPYCEEFSAHLSRDIILKNLK